MEAAFAVEGDGAEIILSKRDKKNVTEEFLSKIGNKISKKKGKKSPLILAEETISTIGGAIVRSIEGKMEVNNTFEARMKRLENTMRPEVADILFGEEE